MTAQKNTHEQSRKRTASTPVAELQTSTTRDSSKSHDIVDDLEFLIPHELSTRAVGLYHCLTTKRVIPLSFFILYQQSQRSSWFAVLNRERRNLKSNINSTEKCFMLNRLLRAYTNNPVEFVQGATMLYETIRRQMMHTDMKFETIDDWFKHVITWQSTQNCRRLFNIKPADADQFSTVFDLQRGASLFFTNSITSLRSKSSTLSSDRYNQLKEILQHIFIITIQPSTVECAGGTKYDKVGQNYISKLNSRLLCLLDTDTISKHLILSNIHVTLYPFDRNIDKQGEEQIPLEWQYRTVIDAHGVSRTFLYADLQNIRLNKLDVRNARPLYSSKLCQIQYKFQIQIHLLGITEDLIFLSRPFGLCSHAQYFPEYLAKIFIYEFQSLSQTVESHMMLPLMTDFIGRYHTKICGVPLLDHTQEFIRQTVQTTFNYQQLKVHSDLLSDFEEVLAKFFSQMEFFVDHPFLSMMYHDHLFHGICDSTIDQQLKGTRNQPEILLRFDTLLTHQPTQQAAVRYIAHNGRLIKASFHMKAFVDEMCRLIYESTDDTIIIPRIYSAAPHLDFRTFQLYYDDELIRISGIEPARQEAYKPLIPVLWSTLRTTATDEISVIHGDRSNSPVISEPELMKFHSSSSRDSSRSQNVDQFNERRRVTSDRFIEEIVEQLSDVVIEYRQEQTLSRDASSPQESLIHMGNEEKRKLSKVLQKYLQRLTETSRYSSTTIQTCSDGFPSTLPST